MTGRPTADIVADLRIHAQHEESLCRLTNELKIEAAERLAELDAELVDLYAEHATLIEWRHAIDALRPLDESGQPVSIEQLVATWRAVWDDDLWEAHEADNAIAYLRQVKP